MPESSQQMVLMRYHPLILWDCSIYVYNLEFLSVVQVCINIFKQRGHDVDFKKTMPESELVKIIGEYDALVVRSATKVTTANILYIHSEATHCHLSHCTVSGHSYNHSSCQEDAHHWSRWCGNRQH